MPSPLDPPVTRRAQELWELQDFRGDSLIAQLSYELLDGREDWTKNLPEGDNTRLPSDRSTLNKMAARLGWKTSEELADETDDGPISGITDPIWHLSNVTGRKKAHEYTHYSGVNGIPNELRRADVDQIVFAICMDVAEAYSPHQKMFKEFRPLVRKWVTEEKKAYQEMVAESDKPGRGSEEILAEFLAQGYEIDDGHAGLDIVYTNPEEPEANEESE